MGTTAEPMIEVEQLTKSYAGRVVLDRISFQVTRGEVVGFLGPNGAGKTTTMRILCAYLPPTDGKVRVAGYDVVENPLAVRRHVGYMPENVPLYTDMRVEEYLEYRARLKGVPKKQLAERVAIVCEVCQLAEVRHRGIGALSKGFRQRVGLADALIHDPDLLILDEPTIGLDPHQIRSVRDLIRELGKKHTVLLSTHILSEVEATCSRVLIIHKGRIEAADTPENLSRLVRGGGSGCLRLEIQAMREEASRLLEEISGIEEVEVVDEKDSWVTLQLFAKPGEDIRDQVFDVVRQKGWRLREMSRQRASLEDVFVELTQD
ncbi:ABC-type transport system involved in gliding motility, ATPase component [Candidatus Methylacidithermus pantelleriae]|uniref:ABC-type transport system involved in gliding motility, ATPase component n=2 Tax=Candidatus Methylacidithermus pantelleriae TaxID=2744239 RepID=A0A8J2BW66_9BACT|nr:ATP-binding cassette domain-containing protein [Candidatus Methylacidithermus pantelleriae]CAF0705336.1 ABC-type transport system involved in gliding motility, ATPase component [Candidatus Methylacidithermus pantelleriae]